MVKGNRTPAAIAKWRIIPNIPVWVFENVSGTPGDPKVMHSAEVWDLEERWKEKETIHCK
jgi:hypothetical protein